MPAPRGNTNHLKHGLYSRRFSPEQQAGIRCLSPDDLLQEIAALREPYPVFDHPPQILRIWGGRPQGR